MTNKYLSGPLVKNDWWDGYLNGPNNEKYSKGFFRQGQEVLDKVFENQNTCPNKSRTQEARWVQNEPVSSSFYYNYGLNIQLLFEEKKGL